ncbi:MAG: trp RNA-binding attenuation protein MtrB [Clostridiales bacterium]|nr:trp RNA-binding attenuation protein MtrB [Clostridiales bacterium]
MSGEEPQNAALQPEHYMPQEYVAVRAEENGVTISGLTRGKDTRLSHSEKLDAGEVMLLQFTQHVSAVKIRGKASIYTKHGLVESGI